MIMRKIKRFLLVIIASVLVISMTLILPAGAATTSNKNVKVLDHELVFCELDTVGNVESVRVVNWLALNGNGSVEVRERKEFAEKTKYQGIGGFAVPSDEGQYLVWKDIDVDGNKNLVAQTKLPTDVGKDQAMRIPLDISFQYFMDGRKVKVEDIIGKSGHFKMEVTFKNTSKEKTKVKVKNKDTGAMEEKELDTYLPLIIAPYDWYFDNKVFYNMESDSMGIIFPLPDCYQVAWTFPLFPPATADTQTIYVEADVKNFHLPNLTIPVAFVFPVTNQTDLVSSFKAGFEKLYDGVNKLKDGIQTEVVNKGLGSEGTEDTLLYGINAIDQGLQKMAASDAVPAMKSGLDDKLIPGVSQAAAGAGTIAGGLQTFSSGTSQLLGGMAQIQAGLEQMKAGIGDAATEDTLLYGVSAVIDGLGQLLTGAQLIQGQANTIPTNVATINTLCDQLIALYPAATQPPQIKALADTIQNAAGLINTVSNLMINGIGSATTSDTLLYAMSAIQGGLEEMKAGIGSATTNPSLLYGVDQITMGLKAMQAGLGSASDENTLIGGTLKLKKGLSSGSAADPGIKEGLEQISGGLSSVLAGIGSHGTPDTLLYGANAIGEGLNKMKAGLQEQIINGGLVVMGESLGSTVTFLNESVATVEALKKRAEEFDHFLGKAESGSNVDAESMVRFIYQVKPVYGYKEGKSWITALVLSIVIGLILVAGGILLARRFT
jgi:putative membrane protein